MTKKKPPNIIHIDELRDDAFDALLYGQSIHKILDGEWLLTPHMPGSGRERGRALGFAQCKHCKWKGMTKEMTPTAGSILRAPDSKRPRGYCPTCGGKCMWQRVSVGQWRVLQP